MDRVRLPDSATWPTTPARSVMEQPGTLRTIFTTRQLEIRIRELGVSLSAGRAVTSRIPLLPIVRRRFRFQSERFRPKLVAFWHCFPRQTTATCLITSSQVAQDL